ncbi:hypothetical protein CYMTET_10477 [Cymbomonas tetramitiformis]|uniref:DUF4336 domain-containing protein n=1 Tax=Cymbomonas tetramitiformis TaxID=36881 RepID=A0AAE0GP69_9CHLO|nr:hypothetical protein CYMTET_10477 [Cymbomonas tetramitiformis]
MVCSVLQGVSAAQSHPKYATAGQTVQKRVGLCPPLETSLTGLGANTALRRKTSAKFGGKLEQRTRAITCKSAEDGDKAYRSLLPPYRTRETISQNVTRGVWTFEQPMGYFTALIGNPFPAKGLAYLGQKSVSRMTVVRLRDGKLLVYSPLALTEELRQAVAKLGKVAHVVLPCTSPEHWYYAPKFLDAFPDAEVWAAPFLLTSEKGIPIAKDVRTPELERLKSTRDPQDLGETPPPSWRNQFDLALFSGGPLFTEVALFHRSSGDSQEP